MKSYKNYSLGVLLLLSFNLFISCDDEVLDQYSGVEISSENISTEIQLDGVIKGMYGQAANTNAFGSRILVLGDLISDNSFVSSVQNSGRYLTTNTLSWTVENSDGDFGQLRSLNGIISMANIAINADVVDFDNEQNVRNLKGQAYTARGLSYFYLVGFYASNPTSGLHQDYGVPIYTGEYDPDYRGPRNTVSEVYDQVISDLTQAIEIMDDSAPTNKGYLSKVAAKLILSRVYLTRGNSGDYQLALNYADEVIASAGSTFNFVNTENYLSYFNNSNNLLSENQPETVWEINMTPGASTNPGTNEALGALYANTGSIYFRQDFKSTFPSTDVRVGLLGNLGPEDDPNGVIMRKWPRNTQEGPFSANVKVLRMSEAKLNRIEALYHLGQNAIALTELNEFATIRGGFTYTGENLLNDILTERRKEFFGEGQRFFDLKRNNLPIVKTTNCQLNCEVSANDKIFTFPMPLQEMNLNTLMVQHPQWQ